MSESSTSQNRTTASKALRVNMDLERYGAFAEIGAGQEVARHFFQAGKASQTIAKTMSAYDMTYSDEIYGREKNGRYVCESRVNKMLEKEYSLLIRRLGEKRGDSTSFFAYANTVATGTSDIPRCHGWMGVRFQTKPGSDASDVIMHVRMTDRHRLQQQEALGVLGVNLTDAAFYRIAKPDDFVTALVENLKPGQVVIDVLKFSGPAFKEYDNLRMNLELVRRGLCEAALISPEMDVLNVADAVYGKALLLQRGKFRPVTVTHVDVMEKGLTQLKEEMTKVGEKKTDTLQLMEILLPKNARPRDLEELLPRIEMLAACGYHTLISSLPLYDELKRFFRKFTQAPMGLVMSAAKLEHLFDPKYTAHLEGGLMEGLGRLFDEKTKIYVYPHKTDEICMTSKSFTPKGPTGLLYKFFREKDQITDISGCDETGVYYHSDDTRKLIEKGDKKWEKLVPGKAAELIKKRKLFT